MYEDLFFAVKHYLLECGRNVSTAEIVATKLVNEAVKRNATEEDIKRLRDIFLQQEVMIYVKDQTICKTVQKI